MACWTNGQKIVVDTIVSDLESDGFIHNPKISGTFSEILFRGNEVAKIYDDPAYKAYLDYIDGLSNTTHHPIRLSEIESFPVAPYHDDEGCPCYGTNESVRVVLLREETALLGSARFRHIEPLFYKRIFARFENSRDPNELSSIFKESEVSAILNVVRFAGMKNLKLDLRTPNLAVDQKDRIVMLDPVWDPHYISEKNNRAFIPMRYRTPHPKNLELTSV